MASPGLVVFGCQAALDLWNPGPTPVPTRTEPLTCAGRFNAGLALTALAHGAEQVLVVACAESQCRHDAGTETARVQVGLCRDLLHALGIERDRVALELVRADDEPPVLTAQ